MIVLSSSQPAFQPKPCIYTSPPATQGPADLKLTWLSVCTTDDALNPSAAINNSNNASRSQAAPINSHWKSSPFNEPVNNDKLVNSQDHYPPLTVLQAKLQLILEGLVLTGYTKYATSPANTKHR